MRNIVLAALVIGAAAAAAWALRPASEIGGQIATIELLNVSYDATRELWRAINTAFIAESSQRGLHVTINQSHGGSGSQARAIIDGLEADVATLALWSDMDAIRAAGLLPQSWDKRLPHDSSPYYSTIVFVVRRGNPRGIHDWPDLVREKIEVVTPSPKTSGNGKLSFLAAWASVVRRGGSESDAERFVTSLYQHTPVLDSGARGATATFAQKKIGDVHLTWESEARLELAEADGELEMVYPPISIRADPRVAWIDENVRRKGTEGVAKAYLEFLYTPAGQDILARHFYRPIDSKVLENHRAAFPDLELVKVEDLFESWQVAQQRLFAEGALFDKIYQPSRR